jgi:hypothetical protein
VAAVAEAVKQESGNSKIPHHNLASSFGKQKRLQSPKFASAGDQGIPNLAAPRVKA